jgi:hypothetical protein
LLGTGGQVVSAPRPKAKLLEEPSGSLETSAAEPAEELLRAVADEEQSNPGTQPAVALRVSVSRPGDQAQMRHFAAWAGRTAC